MNYIISHIDHLNQHEVIYVETKSLEDCLEAFKKIFEIYQLVYKNEL